MTSTDSDKRGALGFGLAFLALLFLALLAYGNALKMDFIGDDIGRIVYSQPLYESYSVAMTQVMPDRPLLMSSLWLNYKWGGLSPLGYKLVNLLLHALVGFWLMLLLMDLNPKLRKFWILPFMVSCLFVAHPLNNQAINSICQRGVLLSAFFSLAALRLYIKDLGPEKSADSFRSPALFIFLLSLMAILSKANAVALPPLFIAAGLWLGRLNFKNAVVKALPFFILFIIPVFFRFALKVNEQTHSLPWYKYFQVQVSLLWLYVKLFFAPTGLHFIYNVNEAPGTLNLALALGAHLAVFVFIFWCGWRRKFNTAFFLTATYIAFSPESSILPIRHLFFEHRAYLPLIFFLCAIASFMAESWTDFKKYRRFTAAVLGFVTIGFVSLNLAYNKKIVTYDDWVFYNFSQNDGDLAFNLFNLNDLRERKSPRAEAFSAQVLEVYPENKIYQTYRDLILYSQWTTDAQLAYLGKLSAFLSSPGEKIPLSSRLHFIQFYMSTMQNFLKDIPYREKMDDFIFAQIKILNRSPLDFTPVFKYYKQNLVRLVRTYVNTPPSETWRYVRTLLALKYYFNLRDPQLEQLEQALIPKASKDPKSQELYKAFQNTQPTQLPETTPNID